MKLLRGDLELQDGGRGPGKRCGRGARCLELGRGLGLSRIDHEDRSPAEQADSLALRLVRASRATG